MDQTSVVLWAAGIGAAGAVVTQLLAVVVTSWNERGRRKHERELRFLDLKREHYAEFLASTYSLHDELKRSDGDSPQDHERVVNEFEAFIKGAVRRRQDIALVAPGMDYQCRQVIAAGRGAVSAHLITNAPDKEITLQYLLAQADDCRTAMSTDLGIKVKT